MTKKMLSLRNIFTLALLLEIVIVTSFYLVLNIDVLFILAIYVLLKNVLIFGCMIYMASLLENDTVSVSEALNQDMGNALIFGGIGLIQYDDNRNITWVSDLLLALNIKIVGVKLLEWQPTLASLFEDEDVRLIDVKGRKFEAYNSDESHLIYLKDVTEYNVLEQDFEDGQMCLGYITIDNYDETISNADETKSVEIQSVVRQVIVKWASDNGMIIRRYKSGSYLILFNERIYKKLIEDKFNILDRFKKSILELGEVMTLSIGIGRGTRILGELEQLASSALNLTYSRGGDQVAIKSSNDRVRYFGGTTDTFEKSSKVRARVIAQTISGIIKRSENVYVMGHKYSDLDSLGSSLGVAKLAKSFDKKVHIVIDTDSLEEKTADVVNILKKDERYDDILVSPVEAIERIKKDSLLIIVDHHKPSLSISQTLLEKTKEKVVIDHHRRGEEFIDAPTLTYLEPSASSATELIVELYNYISKKVELTELDATIMYSGMLVDTNQFRQRVGVRTFQSAAKLKEMQADVVRAYEFLEDSFDRTVEVMNISKSAYQFKDHILIAYAKDDDEHDSVVLAKTSNQMLNISHVKAAFTIGRTSKDVISISARSSREINVQMIMELMGGGGHFTMAACQLKEVTVEEARERLEKAINEYLEDRGE